MIKFGEILVLTFKDNEPSFSDASSEMEIAASVEIDGFISHPLFSVEV